MSANKSAGILQSVKTFMKMTPEQRKMEAQRISKYKSPAWYRGYYGTAWDRSSRSYRSYAASKEASK